MKDQFETGSSSAKTHRLTQPSSTLNRRYVGRPTNLAIEEAARMADYLEEHSPSAPGRPSRLVNLRVHNDDLEDAQAAIEEEEQAKLAAKKAIELAEREIEKPRPEPRSSYMSQPMITHEVVELGGEESALSPLPPAPEDDCELGVVSDLPEHTEATQFTSSLSARIDEPAPDEPVNLGMVSDDPNEIITDSEGIIDDISEDDLAAIESSDKIMAVAKAPALPEKPIKNADIDTRALAMSIAADYTAASLGATMANLPTGVEEVDTDDLTIAAAEVQAADSIDQIANTVAGYVNKIRESHDPEEISLAIKDLKDYAEAIKQNSHLPEIAELGDTIEKFIAVTEKSTGIQAASQKKVMISPKVERAAAKVDKSTNRIALGVGRGAKSAKKTAIAKPNTSKNQALMTAQAVRASQGISRSNRNTVSLNTRGHHAMRSASMVTAKTRNPSSSKKLNDEETLRKTMRKVAKMEESSKAARKTRQKSVRKKGRVKRFVLAFSCAAACVAGIIYVVTTNVPDISVRVAAMQAGVDSSYPSYVPTEFSLDGIESNDKEIVLTFTNSSGKSFTLSEKKSAWDSAALERNLVQKTWQDNYSTTHEQGITMYIHESSAAWVNGGVLYQISADGNVLTTKQLRSIATSMQ